jgi:ubiquinone/menaquinone biosynthesis C-methylase UbiE
MVRKINSKVYDDDVVRQGLKYQIDNYYEPNIPSQKRRIDIIVDLLEPKRDEKILDIGCGVGTFAYASACKKAFGFGADYSFESIRFAKILADKYNTDQNSFFVTANALYLPYKDNSFNKIVIADFIEHITDKEKDILLKEAKRVLKPQGKGVIFTPNLIRENIGEIYQKLRHAVFKTSIPVTDLHYGLISRNKFEKLLKINGFEFEFCYADTTRPFLSKIPLFNHLLALNLIWKIKKI